MNGLVDHVPGMQAALVMPHHRANMLLQVAAGVLLGDSRGEPARKLLVPHQRVPAHLHLMAGREVCQKIARDEIVALGFGMDGGPFENVFGDQDVALFGEVGGIIRVVS